MEQQKRIRLAGLTIAQYDAILNHCNSNIFVTDGEGRVLYANGAAERALNCTFDRLRQMDIYQLRADGYTTHSSSADAIKTKRKSFAVYKNNLGEEIATTSTPVLDGEGNIELVVTRSDEVGSMQDISGSRAISSENAPLNTCWYSAIVKQLRPFQERNRRNPLL